MGKLNDIIYFKNINALGGVETWLYNLSKKYEFHLFYKTASPEQIKRLAKNIECHIYQKPLKCNKFFCNYGYDIEVEAEIKKHIVHCDYKNVWFAPIQYDGFEYIGVSKLACDSFTELTGKECELIYNPTYVDKPKVSKYKDNKLHLISATRLSKEKGYNRMKQLANLLDKNKIDYEWIIYTNKNRDAFGNNVIFKKPRLDIIDEIAKADALIQLSDCEAFCYSVVEALAVGTKVIVTDLPVYKELGVKHGENAVICDMEMKHVDLGLIQKKINFKYTPPKDNWGKYLSTKKTYNPDELVRVKILKKYTDLEMGYTFKRNQITYENGEPILMKKSRVSYLEVKGLVQWL